MTGAGIVAIGGMIMRPRWGLPLPDLAAPAFLSAPAFLFRASANRSKFIFSTHNHEYFIQASSSRCTSSSNHQRCSAQHSRRSHLVRMGARHRDHYYGGLLTRSSDTNPSRQPRPTETERGSRRDAQHTRIREAITASCNRKAIGTDGYPRPKIGNSLTSVLGTIPSPRRCESRRRSNAPERKSRGLFLRHTR